MDGVAAELAPDRVEAGLVSLVQLETKPTREPLARGDAAHAVAPGVDRRREHREPELAGSDTASTPPDTPLLAGRPTRYIHSPEKSYMPHVVITLSTRTAATRLSARTPVTGLTPPFARVAAITARSVASTRIEHCRK